MTVLVEWIEQPELTEPTMLVMLQGWFDTSGAAQAAMEAIESGCHARTIARFDRDTFIDYRARRPVMEIRDGVNARLVWPDIELKVGTDAAGQQLLFLSGYEPDAAWERFAIEVIAVAARLGVAKMIGLGAYPFGAPHTRPVRMSTTSPDPGLTAELPYLRSSADVPAGVSAVLEQAFHQVGVPAMTLWAQVPHYVSAMSYPAASVALIEAVKQQGDVLIDATALRGESAVQRQRLDSLIAANEEHANMVRQLEDLYDAQLSSTTESTHPSMADGLPIDVDALPSADELAAELEQFLRDQGQS